MSKKNTILIAFTIVAIGIAICVTIVLSAAGSFNSRIIYPDAPTGIYFTDWVSTVSSPPVMITSYEIERTTPFSRIDANTMVRLITENGEYYTALGNVVFVKLPQSTDDAE